MKFLDESDIELINQFLTFDTLDVHITGGCDLFATKAVGADRKLYKIIDKQIDALIESTNYTNSTSNLHNHHIDETNQLINNEFLETKRRFSSNSDSYQPPLIRDSLSENTNDTPFGPLEQTTSRRTFAYLIGILNSSYPDNDFSSLQPRNFLKISQHVLKSKFENTLISLGKSNFEFIWDIIDQHIELNSSAYYELSIDDPLEDDEQSARSLWQYKWFIFNKKKKRVAFLYLNGFRLQSPKLYPVSASRRLTIENDLDNEEYDLTYPSDTEKNDFEVFEDDEEDYKKINSNNTTVELGISN